MDLITGFPQYTDWKGNGYDLILVIVNQLTKMVYYKSMQMIISILVLAKGIFNIIVRYYGLPDSIVSNCDSVFTFKFWSSLCYFLSIEQKLSTGFYPQTDGQTE